jgi:hypothetical protein
MAPGRMPSPASLFGWLVSADRRLGRGTLSAGFAKRSISTNGAWQFVFDGGSSPWCVMSPANEGSVGVI